MANLRQFSLSYILLEFFWIGVALMFTAPMVRQDPGWQLAALVAFPCWGAVIGGLFHAMRDGAIAAFLLLGATLVSYSLIKPL